MQPHHRLHSPPGRRAHAAAVRRGSAERGAREGGDGAAPAPEDWRRILAGFTVAMLAAAATFAATAAAAKAEARDESNGREEGEEASPLLREEGEGEEDV